MKSFVIGIASFVLLALVAIRGCHGMVQEKKLMQDRSESVQKKDGQTYSESGYDVTLLSEDRIEQLAENLSSEERHVILEKGTERAFSGALFDQKEEGLYACRLCGLPLFSSDAKFESGTGWPSFFEPLDPEHVHEERDTNYGTVRTEILCARCRGHLGHVFDDGPRPTGLRYCMNSAALRFHDNAADLPPDLQPVVRETAYFAGGCFWGIEDRFQQVPGVMDAVSGYQGGHVARPGYKQVCSGNTGHAETVRVTFDPNRVTYRKLLEWFFKFHDPTQLNRQGPDAGTQYRSAVFAANGEQFEEAKTYLAELQQSERFRDRRIVTQIEKAGPFHEAEDYHQDYHAKHGGHCPIPTSE